MALSDPQGILASPLTIIERSNDAADLAALAGIISSNQVEQVIVGLPRLMSGSIGAQAEKVIAFTRELQNKIDVPIDFRDERFSTVSARRLMQGQRKKKEKSLDDAIAAALILQGYLEEAL